MITFLQVCLYAFAGCATAGLLPVAVLAAMTAPVPGKRRSLAAFGAVLALGALIVFVLVSAAGDLR